MGSSSTRHETKEEDVETKKENVEAKKEKKAKKEDVEAKKIYLKFIKLIKLIEK